MTPAVPTSADLAVPEAPDTATSPATTAPGVTASEVRVLDGPNLYFTRPAVKVSLHVPGYLAMDRKDAADLARRVGLGSSRPGKAGSAQRQRFVMRLAAHVMRRIASGVGVNRIAVRSRTGSNVDEIVVAIPWRHRTWGEVAGEQLGPVLAQFLGAGRDGSQPTDAIIEEAAARIREVEPGPGSTVISPTVPVVSITGTNGKTTTTRIIAHISMTAGFKT
ncbi:MAG: Mur ligase, partial [Lapillicoccus sp.]